MSLAVRNNSLSVINKALMCWCAVKKLLTYYQWSSLIGSLKKHIFLQSVSDNDHPALLWRFCDFIVKAYNKYRKQ